MPNKLAIAFSINAMCNLILQNPLARGEGEKGDKSTRSPFGARKKIAHRVINGMKTSLGVLVLTESSRFRLVSGRSVFLFPFPEFLTRDRYNSSSDRLQYNVKT